tara:strand:- start:11 stop:1231 length:1221 start_codon:yes stop_codon:yes gene_type:complete
MGHRHMHALRELRNNGLSQWELVGVCDIDRKSAESVSALGQEFFGHAPAVYVELEELVQKERPDAVSIVTTAPTHLAVASKALSLGVDVLVEKPIVLDMVSARLLEEAVKGSGQILSVAENFRRDPLNRLIKALLDAKVIGEPLCMVHNSFSGNRQVVITPWRHLRKNGGLMIDIGVHHTDVFQYFLGMPRSVSAWTNVIEKTRRWNQGDGPLGAFYEVSNRGFDGEFFADAEDAALAIFQHGNGVVTQYSHFVQAGGGEGKFLRRIYGTDGMIECPEDRSGNPVKLDLRAEGKLEGQQVLDLVPHFHLDSAISTMFGRNRMTSYQMEFNEGDRKITASEYWELSNCLLSGLTPEVGLTEAVNAVAGVLAMLESGHIGRPVEVNEILSGKANSYQALAGKELRKEE